MTVTTASRRTRPGLVLLAVSMGQFLLQLDLTIVNVALPDIGSATGAPVPMLQWVVDGYNLAVASLLLTGGRIGDRSGHRRVFLAGLGLFALGSALCATAPSADLLVASRVLQGVGAALELPATLAILTHTFTEPRRRAQAVGIWASAAGSSLVIGPVAGGALVSTFGWRAVFAINVPVVAAIAVLTVCVVPETRATRSAGLDVPGQVLGSAALALLAGGAIEGGRLGFGAALPVTLLAAGAVIGALFVAVERPRPDPVLQLSLFRRGDYAAVTAGGLVMGFVTIGALFVFSLFFQQAQGLSALQAGLRFLPLTVVFVAIGPAIGRAMHHTGHRVPMAVGATLLAAGSLTALTVGEHAGYLVVGVPFAIIGLGYGLLSTPMATAALAAVPPDRAGMASSTNLTARLVGGVFGVAVLGSLLPAGASGEPGGAFVSGVHAAMLVCACVAAVGAVLATVLIPGRRRSAVPAVPGR
jgi:DHA2 family methylenomycin A resistance protein-like MFS transporter